MTYMILGGYTFAINPSSMSPIKANRGFSSAITYSSVATFAFGPQLPGVKLVLRWEEMLKAQWDELVTLEAADAQIVFDPYGATDYNVEIEGLSGIETDGFSTVDSNSIIESVELTLVIISVVP